MIFLCERRTTVRQPQQATVGCPLFLSLEPTPPCHFVRERHADVTYLSRHLVPLRRGANAHPRGHYVGSAFASRG